MSILIDDKCKCLLKKNIKQKLPASSPTGLRIVGKQISYDRAVSKT